MHFEFATSGRIIFGPGTSADIPGLAAPLGQRAFVVTSSCERAAALLERLARQKIPCNQFLVKNEPDLDNIVMATRSAQEFDCDLVIGFGGGSALDTGKAVAALLANPGSPLDYLEIVGTGRLLEKPSIPYIAIPTTAGTGSEVTRNAVITIPDKKVKVSLRSPFMLPKIAIVDPELTYTLPSGATASTGLDALTQLIEPFVSTSPTPLTDILCRDGIARVAQALLRAYKDGFDANARMNMALASMYGGMALTNARLGVVHGLAGPIGGWLSTPHGAICARLLPFVMETNLLALRSRSPDSPALDRYTEIALLLTGNPKARAEDGIAWIHRLCLDLSIQPLSTFGLTEKEIPALIAQGQRASSTKGNPIPLTDEEFSDILRAAI
jgi:alcohol dehydrogenase class IV